MDKLICIKCGLSKPEHTVRFVAVNVKSNSSVSCSGKKRITTTTTTESIIGIEKCHVCEQCIQKKRKKQPLPPESVLYSQLL